MDRLWENEEYNSYQDYISRSHQLSDSYSVAIIIFGIIEVVTTGVSFVFISGIISFTVFAAVGLLFIVLFYYYAYRAEKRYRQITASFGYFISKSPISIIVYIFAALYYFVISFQMLYAVVGGVNPVVMLSSMVVVLLSAIFINPLRRMARTSTERVENVSIIESLRNASLSTGMGFIEPRVLQGRPLKFANAFCAGLIKHRIFISDYLLDNLSEKESLAVLLHEYGHAKYHHLLQVLVPLGGLLALMFTLTFYGYTHPDYFFLQPFFPLLLLLQLPIFYYKQWLEMKADQFAAGIIGADTVSSALVKVSMLNLTTPNRSSYTHPSLNARRRRLKKLKSKGKVGA